MGLYGHRIGLFSTLCDNQTEKENVMGIVKAVARPQSNNTPTVNAQGSGSRCAWFTRQSSSIISSKTVKDAGIA